MKKIIISAVIAIVALIAAWEIYAHFAYKSYERQANEIMNNAAQQSQQIMNSYR